MEKSDKRRCKHVSPQTNSMIAKYGNYGDDRTECWRKYRQDRDLPICHERSERRQSNPPFDTTTGYHCTESYKQRKHHGLPAAASRTNKYLIPPVPEENYRVDSKNHGILRALRSQFYPNNIAIVRKTRYKDDDDADEDSKYVLESTVDDNVEKETAEEVDEEHEDASEYSDKDYEEQEADDEVDEESDVVERQMERLRAQRKSRIAPLQRGQRTSVVTESTHNRRGHQKISMGKDSERCCHTAIERDNIDVPTEDDDDEDQDVCDSAIYPLKKSTWRYQVMHQDRECRHHPRNYVERYSDFNRMSSQQTRRPRTTKPNIESSMTSTRMPQTSIRNNRCSQCGVSKGQTTKTTASRNAGCRLEDNRYFTKVPIGDEVVGFEDPEPSYQTKTRRSKESRSLCYDQREESRKMDAELGAIYKTCRSKNPRELSNGFVDRTKQSLRSSNRHDPTTSLKNDNHYWQ